MTHRTKGRVLIALPALALLGACSFEATSTYQAKDYSDTNLSTVEEYVSKSSVQKAEVVAVDLLEDRTVGDTTSWKVCTQESTPAADVSVSAEVVVGVVRVNEECPTTGVEENIQETRTGELEIEANNPNGYDRPNVEEPEWLECIDEGTPLTDIQNTITAEDSTAASEGRISFVVFGTDQTGTEPNAFEGYKSCVVTSHPGPESNSYYVWLVEQEGDCSPLQ